MTVSAHNNGGSIHHGSRVDPVLRLAGAALVAMTGLLAALSGSFGPGAPDPPVARLVAIELCAGFVFLVAAARMLQRRGTPG